MSKYKEQIKSIYSLSNYLNKENILPIYFFFGEDYFTLNNAVKTIEKETGHLISTEFDRETINPEKNAKISDLIDLAYTFPFGSDKKLIVVKNFENYIQKKLFAEYVENPSETTVLVAVQNGKITNFNIEPYLSLSQNNFLFEANELKGKELEIWVKNQAASLGLNITPENVQFLIEIVGEDKSLLDMHLQKFINYVKDSKEINEEVIEKLSSTTKEFSIFDLLNSLGRGDKRTSLKVTNNLLNNGKDLLYIIPMLTKYLSTIAQSIELVKRGFSDQDASRAIGVSLYYYKNCRNASFFKNEKILLKSTQLLLETDIKLKSQAIDQKILSAMLIGGIFS